MPRFRLAKKCLSPPRPGALAITRSRSPDTSEPMSSAWHLRQIKDFVLGLGANEFIDYENQIFEDLVSDADVVIDALRDPAHLERSIKLLKNGGRLISLITSFDNADIIKKASAKNFTRFACG
ncbi:zinc-binding dehydrogenase [Mucilaginibacter sabulilitoris]|uniref:Zinc-binding dehydrogenase n=1 Tax=Mucilaginibacter sabulilitoris TaxID=1173583 RepID=A0ABZ0TRM2_9SPHI|nr:zinc-binding dehydrogenase [Mucilaginibacter sabulilitoris]WPU95559.1 zinc-binding dehydrogenase [Mucilaginibacter sabulilitoris]